MHIRRGLVCAVAAFTGFAGAARAESLAEAIALAYETNPTLQAQRAQQRALDESYVQARSGWRPSLDVQAGANYSNVGTGRGHLEANSGSLTLGASQPIYTGGRTGAAVRAADADIRAGREGLRSLEAQVLQSVVQAYEDVRRDQQVVTIRQNNVVVLQSQFEETQAKFGAGQVTRTDTAQAQAQLANARAQLSQALGQLQISRANYAAVVGQNPGDLAPEPPLPGLPRSVDQAFDLADAGNANLNRARIAEEASRARIAQARAAGRPFVSATASLGYAGTVAPFDPRDYQRNVSAGAVLRQPLFTGGVVRSQVRAAIEQNSADRINIEGARRSVVQGVSQAWNVMQSAHAAVAANVEQVAAARVAFEGIQEQYRVGLSTTLDVLIQQQTLQTAELQLVSARHDEYVAQAALLAAMGRLEAGALVRGAPLYDPSAAFARVRTHGATPWEGAIASLDALGAPRIGPPAALPAPLLPAGPVVMVQAEAPPPVNQPLSTASPTAPPVSPR